MNQLDVIKTMAAIMGASTTTEEQKKIASSILTDLMGALRRDVTVELSKQAGIIS